jgi:hypothetical protein
MVGKSLGGFSLLLVPRPGDNCAKGFGQGDRLGYCRGSLNVLQSGIEKGSDDR